MANLKGFQMKIKYLAMLTLLSTQAFAAVEYTPQKADSLEPFKEITVKGIFNNIHEASKAVSKKADKAQADGYYITNIGYHTKNDSIWIVTAYLFHKDAEQRSEATLPRYHGVIAYPKKTAISLEPYKKIIVRGDFVTPASMIDAVADRAAYQGAYAFYINEVYSLGDGNASRVVAYLYQKDAPVRQVKLEEADIPYDSESGQAALAAGGERAKQVEKPDTYSNDELGKKSKRYTVKLANGVRIEELNKTTAQKMQAFDHIIVKGYFPALTQMSKAVAKKAAAKGAKYYHISRKVDRQGNGNYVLYVDLYR